MQTINRAIQNFKCRFVIKRNYCTKNLAFGEREKKEWRDDSFISGEFDAIVHSIHRNKKAVESSS